MRTSTIFVAALASASYAAADAGDIQKRDDITGIIQQIPPCAQMCLLDATKQSGCDLQNFKCLCTKQDVISKNALPCLGTSGCSPADISKLQTMSTQLCAKIGSGGGDSSASSAAPATSATPSSAGGGSSGSNDTTPATNSTGGGYNPPTASFTSTPTGGSSSPGATAAAPTHNLGLAGMGVAFAAALAAGLIL